MKIEVVVCFGRAACFDRTAYFGLTVLFERAAYFELAGFRCSSSVLFRCSSTVLPISSFGRVLSVSDVQVVVAAYF
jgi:hypothetical protein